MPALYLAGPTVFAADPGAIFDRMKAICHAHGVDGVSPLDNQIGLEHLAPDRALLHRIVRADIALMHRVDAGIFCLDGFRRSPEMDPGTAFEVGYMHALRKPLAGWTQDTRDYPARVAAHFSGRPLVAARPGAQGGTSGTLRDPDGVLVHSAGCLQNAMVHCSIEASGGDVFADPAWEVAFDRAVARLATRLLTQA
jgi:nucleoside 2-deoxyribosyltransferase